MQGCGIGFILLLDDKHSRWKALARHRHVSVNKLIEELSTQALAEFDSEVRFRTLAGVLSSLIAKVS